MTQVQITFYSDYLLGPKCEAARTRAMTNFHIFEVGSKLIVHQFMHKY